MSQNVWDTILASSTSGTQLATLLNDFKDAVMSGFSGTSRPTEIQSGGMWVDTTDDASGVWALKLFDSTNDITIMTIDKNLGAAAVNSAVGSFDIVKGSDDTVGPILKLTKERITGGGQTLDGDILGQINVYGTTSAGVNTVQFQMEVVTTDNTDAATKGSRFVIRGVNDGTGALVEYIRVVDGKFAVGTTSPEQVMDVEGNIQSKKTVESAAGASVIIKKSRVTNNGQTLSGDTIGNVDFKGVDNTGAVVSVASVETTLGETTTTTTRGSTVTIKNTVVGAAAPTNAVVINDDIALNRDTNITGALDVTGAVTFDETVYVADNKLVSVDDMTVRGLLTANELAAGTVTTIVDPTIILNKDGNQATANANTSGFIVEMSDATDAQIGYDSTLASKFKCGEVGALKEIINTDSAQIVENKSIRNPSRADVKKDTLANLTTYATTAGNGQWCFATDTKEMYQVIDGVLEAAGGGAGIGGFNYVDNYTYKNNIDGVGTSSDPTNFAKAWESTNKFREAGCLKVTKANSNESGEYLPLYAWTLFDWDKTKVLQYAIDGDLSDADIANGDYELQIWSSPDNVTFTYLSGSRLELAAVKDRFIGKFQATTDSYYQLRLVVVTPDTAQDIMYFKNLVIGEQEPNATGAIIRYIGIETLTPTNSTGIASQEIRLWQMGEFLRVSGVVFWNNVGAGTTFGLTLPSKYVVDTSKAIGGNAADNNASGMWSDIGVGNKALRPYLASTPANTITFVELGTNNVLDGTQMASGDSLSFSIDLPILGWSSNMQLSSQTSGRQVSLDVVKATTQTLASSGVDVANYSTPRNDSVVGFNTTTGVYTFQQDDTVNISINGFGRYGVTASTDASVALVSSVSGSIITIQLGDFVANRYFGINGSISGYKCKKGETIVVKGYYGTTAWTVHSLGLSLSNSSGSQTIAKEEKVVEIVSGNAGLTWDSTERTLTYPTTVKSTHGWMNKATGEFTSGKDGDLVIQGHLHSNSAFATAVGSYSYLDIHKNGSQVTGASYIQEAEVAGSFYQNMNIAFTIPVLKGDVVRLRFGVSGANAGLTNTCYFSFTME